MHAPILLLVLIAACSLARPPVATPPTPTRPRMEPLQENLNGQAMQEIFQDYMLPRFVLPNYARLVDDVPRYAPPPPPDYGWLAREIERLNFLRLEEEFERLNNPDRAPEPQLEPYDNRNGYVMSAPPAYYDTLERDGNDQTIINEQKGMQESESLADENKKFGLTPREKGYFDKEELATKQSEPTPTPVQQTQPDPAMKADMVFEKPRKTRQNPNLSRTKTLVAENLDKLRAGLSEEDGNAGHIHVIEGSLRPDPADSIYGIAVIAAIGAALTIAVLGFAFGWYTLSKKAKAAADVDYPAYGVTGPTIDNSGDRKLAHSAHMYHYQHQKQQILALERNGEDQREGSVSDPESEEENEEGDYTVYECPGFATTGDMEVKNPMFLEDPTPATPGKCELVKPQPKD